jgi:hypothetical protein
MSSAERRTLYLTSRLRRAVAVFDDEMRIRAITVLCADPALQRGTANLHVPIRLILISASPLLVV